MKKRGWSKDQIDQIRDLKAGGYSSKEIAAVFGTNAKSITNCALKYGFPFSRRIPWSWTQAQDDLLRKLHAQGKLLAEVATTMDMQQRRVRKRAKELGLPFRKQVDNLMQAWEGNPCDTCEGEDRCKKNLWACRGYYTWLRYGCHTEPTMPGRSWYYKSFVNHDTDDPLLTELWAAEIPILRDLGWAWESIALSQGITVTTMRGYMARAGLPA